VPNVLPKTHKKASGFTLIELLVVITVIGALSGVLLGVINGGGIRAKARDSQRKSDIKRIQTALELYFADFRAYPISNNGSNLNSWEQVNPAQTNVIIGALQPNYIDPVPVDPSNTVPGNSGPCGSPTNYRYNYRSDGSYYYLTAIMEITSSAEDSPCPGTIGCGATFDTDAVCYFAQNP